MSNNEPETPHEAPHEHEGAEVTPEVPHELETPHEAPHEGDDVDDVPAHETDDDDPTGSALAGEWFKIQLPPGLTAHDFALFPECPLCEGYGRVPGDVPADPHSTPCDDCRGYGVVYTGSKVPGHEQRTCVSCDGSGYIAERVQVFNFEAPAVPPAGSPIPQAGQAPWPGAQWDSARGIWRDSAELAAAGS